MNDGFLNRLLPYFAIAVPAIVSIYSVHKNFNNLINDKVFEQRKILYLKYLNLLLKIQQEPKMQFELKTLKDLESLQSEFYIYASKNCRDDFEIVISKIKFLCDEFLKNKDPNEDEIIAGDISDAIILQDSYDSYKEDNQIKTEEFRKIINKTIKDIQLSLKIEKGK